MTDETRSARPKCAVNGCDRLPTHYPLLTVPPHGFGSAQAVSGVMGLALCRDHAHAVTVDDLRKHGGDALRDRMVRAMGLGLPDWTRATIEVRRMGDKQWLAYHAARVPQGAA